MPLSCQAPMDPAWAVLQLGDRLVGGLVGERNVAGATLKVARLRAAGRVLYALRQRMEGR